MKLLKISLINTPKNSETFHLFLLKGRKSRICIRPSPFIAPSKLPDVSYGLSEARAAVEWGLSVARKIALTMNLSVSPSPLPRSQHAGVVPSPSPAVKKRGWFFNGRIQTDPPGKNATLYSARLCSKKRGLLLASFCPKSRTLLSDFFGFSLGKERVRVTHMVSSFSHPSNKNSKKSDSPRHKKDRTSLSLQMRDKTWFLWMWKKKKTTPLIFLWFSVKNPTRCST